jgi:hypothetical protein
VEGVAEVGCEVDEGADGGGVESDLAVRVESMEVSNESCGLIRLGHEGLCCKLVVLHVVVGLGPETPLLYTPRLTSDE